MALAAAMAFSWAGPGHSYVQHFVRYEECPGPAQEKAIAAAKAMAEE